ncbi:aspartyl/glutamyl-tRNA amidotransferase subunit B [Patescibacteria group bacterium]|nr:aspartyl/glutamyl-tRNA amidotransferase subunit B [Patescibacteria group bacterium]MBU4115933.1 aspartyl/glutamyl-tRNA amidotransferase subunit B [Patescibacteria group bacterium]
MKKTYKPTIGLEIHAELKTETKMFCNSKNDPEEKSPNVNICPVCMAHPGTLPVINKEAIKSVLKVGIALNGKIADFSEFDRKNYFYPDIPKGYQISQYKHPLVSGGELVGVKITRIHLEEDTAKLIHPPAQAGGKRDFSLVDYNRAGVPLMELVTEPVIEDGETAVKFAKELQLILRYLNVSDADMEKGQMRVEANISVAPKSQMSADGTQINADKDRNLLYEDLTYKIRGIVFSICNQLGSGHKESVLNDIRENLHVNPRESVLGTKVEVKNLNSFKSVGLAIDFEIKRQTEVLERGEGVKHETRGWDENKQMTFSQREKEFSHDYRYFPEPDLPKLKLNEIKEFKKENLLKEIPELPEKTRERYKREYGIKDEDIESYITDKGLRNLFEETIKFFNDNKNLIKLTSNYVTSDIVGFSKGSDDAVGKIEAKYLSKLIKMISANVLSSRGAKNILFVMYKQGGSPEEIAKESNLLQISNKKEMESIVKKIIKDNPDVVRDYKKGKELSIQYLIGEGMKKSKGSANPKVLKEIFISILNSI